MFRLFTAVSLAAALCLASAAGTASARAPTAVRPWTIPSDARIHAILVDMVDRRHVAPGMVIGIIGPQGRRIIAYGRRDANDPRPVDGDTLFEIGSITKLFTAVLLTDMVQRGEVRLEDPAAGYLPPGMTLPARGGRQITLVDLATHTSGLPDFPPNLAPKTPMNPFGDYDQQRLAAFLAGYRLPFTPGAGYAYSSVGAGLLGDLLARREGVSYETLVRGRVLGPLGMSSTGITLTPDQARRLTPGHTRWLAPAPYWTLPVLSGAAAMRSSASDMLTFLGANLGYVRSPLNGPFAAMLGVRRRADWIYDSQAIGWVVSRTPMGEIAQHEGMTSGCRAYIAYDLRRRTGIVVLANAATLAQLDDLGDSLLIGTIRP